MAGIFFHLLPSPNSFKILLELVASNTRAFASVDSEAILTKHPCRSVEKHGSVKSQIIILLLQS